MLFVNIASDLIELYWADHEEQIVYQQLERVLPARLTSLISEREERDFRVVNGPGGFTSLRIGCLVLNTLQMTYQWALTFRAMTKLDLYRHLIDQEFLPEQGLITIGQKNNVWWYDHQQGAAEIVHRDRLSELPSSYFVDRTDRDYGVDLDQMVDWQFDGEQLHVRWQGRSLSLYPTDAAQQVDYLQPFYGVQPTLGATRGG